MKISLKIIGALMTFCLVGSMAMAAPSQPQVRAEIPEAKINAAMDAFKENNPRGYLRLLELREENPELFAARRIALARKHMRFERMKNREPENAQLQEQMWENRNKMREVLKDHQKADSRAGKVILESQLEKLLTEQFDLRQKMKANRADRIEAKLQELRAELAKERSGERRERFVRAWKEKLITDSKTLESRRRARR